jgi:hypothetical protein
MIELTLMIRYSEDLKGNQQANNVKGVLGDLGGIGGGLKKDF